MAESLIHRGTIKLPNDTLGLRYRALYVSTFVILNDTTTTLHRKVILKFFSFKFDLKRRIGSQNLYIFIPPPLFFNNILNTTGKDIYQFKQNQWVLCANFVAQCALSIQT